MTLLKKNGRRNEKLFPFGVNGFFGNSFLAPRFMDIDNDMFDGSLKTPPANVTETKDEFKVELSVPGLKREDFKVEVEDGILTVSCEKKDEKKDDTENYTRREFSYETFYRTFQLPEAVAEDKINARYENGMLNISIPKKEIGTSRPKKAIDVA